MRTGIEVALILCMMLISSAVNGEEFSMTWDGVTRTWVVYDPDPGSDTVQRPLVLGLHGTGANGNIFMVTASLVRKADSEDFIVACPNGLDYGEQTYFNAGGAFEDLTGGTDDIGFIAALIDTMKSNYNVDPSRIYVMGFSNGSSMAYRVAAELSDVIAGVGAVSGQMVYEYCDPVRTVPVMHFHGLSDRLIPFEGRGENIPSVESALEIWRGINGCSPDPETIYDSNGILGLRWTSGDGKSDVVLYTIEEQEHEWPRRGSLGISATDAIWDFFMESEGH